MNGVKSVEEEWIQDIYFLSFFFSPLLSEMLNRKAGLSVVLAHLEFLSSAFLRSGLPVHVSQCPHVRATLGSKLNVLLFAVQTSFWRKTSRANWVTTKDDIKVPVE